MAPLKVCLLNSHIKSQKEGGREGWRRHKAYLLKIKIMDNLCIFLNHKILSEMLSSKLWPVYCNSFLLVWWIVSVSLECMEDLLRYLKHKLKQHDHFRNMTHEKIPVTVIWLTMFPPLNRFPGYITSFCHFAFAFWIALNKCGHCLII